MTLEMGFQKCWKAFKAKRSFKLLIKVILKNFSFIQNETFHFICHLEKVIRYLILEASDNNLSLSHTRNPV